MAALDFAAPVVESAKKAISTGVDFIVKVLTPLITVVRKIPGVDKFLSSVALNGPRYGTVAAAFVAKFVSDEFAYDLGKVEVPPFGWEVSVTNIISVLIAFAIGYIIQKVLTVPRAVVPESVVDPTPAPAPPLGDPVIDPDDPEVADFFAGILGSDDYAPEDTVADGGKGF